jgi:hypothetical protein
VAYFSGATAQAEVKANAPTAQYQVSINSTTRGPIIEVNVTDKSAKGALSALDYLTAQIPVELQHLQQQVDAPADAVITSMPLTIDAKAKADYSGTIRMIITAVVVGLLVTGLVAFGLDGLLLHRRARQQARAERGNGEKTTTPEDDERPTRGTRRRGAQGDNPPDELASHFSGPIPVDMRRKT